MTLISVKEPHLAGIELQSPFVRNVGKTGQWLGETRTAPSTLNIKELTFTQIDDMDHFKEFWEKYPRKVAKSTAQKKWMKLNPSEDLFKRIMEALERQKKSEQWQTLKYVPHASTWLNQERFNDEVELQASDELFVV